MTRSPMARKPPSMAALLFLAQLLDLSQAHLLPRETVTLPHHVLNVVDLPPPPTAAPKAPRARYRSSHRRAEGAADVFPFNTVCGYVGGDPALPATCSAGSHCVLDAEHGAIGCCPDGVASCTTGVFTGCVDYNSGPQTVADPYVYTCAGSDVCYRNEFAGGFFQYGCGTASDLANTVAATAPGITSELPITSVSVKLTASPTSLATPASIDPSTGTKAFTRSSKSGSTSASSTTSASSSSSPTSSEPSITTTSSSSASSSPTRASGTAAQEATSAPASGATESNGGHKNTGAIVGGTIGGLAGLALLLALALLCWKRRKGNVRSGPGPGGDTQYISPMSGNQGFHPIHSNQETSETGMYPHGNTAYATAGHDAYPPMPMQESRYALPYTSAAVGGATGGAAGLAAGSAYGAHSSDQRGLEGDQVPLTREIDDFSASFNHALERIDEHGGETGDLGEYSSSGEHVNGTMSHGGNVGNISAVSGGIGMAYGGNGYGSIGDPTLVSPETAREGHSQQAQEELFGSPGRPLWQQNRRYSRSPMWM